MVGWLAHVACPLTGEWFTVGGGHIARVGLTITEGFVDRDTTIDTIDAHADEIMGSAASPLGGGGAEMSRMMRDYPGADDVTETQLRRYEINPGEMDDFLVAWRGVVAHS